MTEQPAPDKPARGARPSEKPAQETAAPLPPGHCGQFLQELGINSRRLADHCGVECIEIAGDDLQAVMKKLRNSPETRLNYLLTITGTDCAEHFESVYHLASYENTKELVVKVKVEKSSVPEGKLPVVPSLANFWGTANWHERETYDLVGIRYSSHPYLRRILNPWDWEGYPLRRDYKQPIDGLNDKNLHSMR